METSIHLHWSKSALHLDKNLASVSEYNQVYLSGHSEKLNAVFLVMIVVFSFEE